MNTVRQLTNVSFQSMLNELVHCILNEESFPVYFYRNGYGEYHEIVEMDLLAGRFTTDDRDFSEFSWEMHENNIYKEERRDTD